MAPRKLSADGILGDGETSGNTSQSPAPLRRASSTASRIVPSLATSPTPVVVPTPDSYYQHDTTSTTTITQGTKNGASTTTTDSTTTSSSVQTELRLFLELAIPTILFGASFVISPFLTASIVGRKFGATHLSAFTLANLTGNLCTFSFVAGLYSASDTLSPQAFGIQNYKEVGLIAIRGMLASTAVLIPVNIPLVLWLKDILIALGQDEEASDLAQQWYRIFVLALPFCIVFYTGEKFLSAQHNMKPLIFVVLIASGIILPISLHVFTELFGFLGSAMAYVFYQASSAVLLLMYLKWLQPHVPETWPGLGAWREALERDKMMEYLYLGAGGILVQSEWVYWEALSLIVGRLGVVPLTAHAIPNNLIMAMCQIPFAAGTALAIRMGTTISESVTRAKAIALVTLLVTTVLFGLVSIVLYVKADALIRIFTYDEEVIALSKTVWWKVCTYNLNVTVFAILSGVSTGLGRQWTFGAANFFFLWVVGIPVTIYHALILGGGLDAAWTWVNAPYVGINVTLLVIFFGGTDWNAVKDKINNYSNDEINDDDEASRMELEGIHKKLLSGTKGTHEERKGLLHGGDFDKTEYGGANGV
mmetsp:Transcript_13334/g.20966  ORF Transcript_13334/g.20966 Transcript_13334/m.20966 type:complete len:591 (-) Transcript_13334:68-1840(-)|eukprot:CAMPEP_0117048378 /NCGR_PEP_ID=MMETSP0472-20121206/33441_1 /TAXON_ID=693140 ORGANISM="Tiarina fusus, Strain LIS" /NCGR_SAMPLE_ID=MMETSP0472 /ASSEMBLY_ACC=CAM_ASM_000603 /LENGTH=590 /DNA_ID=CAMNT_0004761453 /DNA_START=167 /DNA_END=1939 /DNA_ORIENTATION=+